jgi:hypothetical protein
MLVPVPPGPDGERHHALVSVDGSTNVSMKVPQLRNLGEKVGFDMTQPSNRAGFGFLHDGSVDSLARFVAEPVFNVESDQDVADVVAFLLSFSGSDLPVGSPDVLSELPGPASRDTHAAVGAQVTLGGGGDPARLDAMLALARAGAVDLVAHGGGRGWWFDEAGDRFQSDRNGETVSESELRALARPGYEITWTVVPLDTGRRLGIDRDNDGIGDATERERGTGPEDASPFPD